MPRRKTDLSSQIEAILSDAVARIVRLLEDEREAMLESVQEAVTTLDSTLKGRSPLAEALRAAMPAASGATPSRRPPRDQWVRTADVVVRLRELLAARPKGARIAELRDETQFSDMQLHRALRELRDAGEVVKEGELRRTLYRATGRARAPSKKKTASSTATKTATRATSRTSARAATKATTKKRAATPKMTVTSKSTAVRPPRAEWVSTDEVMRAARKALRRRARGLPMSELCAVTGYSDKQLHRAIVALVDEGAVTRVGRLRSMRYVLTGK